MKNNDKYKKSMEVIKISNDVEEKIMNKLKISKLNFKMAFACMTILLVSIVSVTITYAEEIKECWQNIKFTFSTKEKEEETISNFGYKITAVDNLELDNGDYSIDSYDIYGDWITKEQLEKDLGFKILKYDKESKDKVKYALWNSNLGDNNLVQGITIYHPHIYEYSPSGKEITCIDDDVCVYFGAYVFTKNAKPNDYEEFLNSSILTSAHSFIEKYESDKFGTVMIDKVNTMITNPITNEVIENALTVYAALFTYDNVIYAFEGTNITIDQLKEIINSLHY